MRSAAPLGGERVLLVFSKETHDFFSSSVRSIAVQLIVFCDGLDRGGPRARFARRRLFEQRVDASLRHGF